MVIRGAAAVLGLVCLIGCGGSEPDRPDTFAVTGVVKLDGTPVEGASVTFNPESREGQSAFGTTGADGTYHLTTFEAGDGAVTGNYIVTVTLYPKADAAATAGTTEDGGEPEGYIPPGSPGYKEPAAPENKLPQRYAAMHTSDLRAVVDESEENVVNFDLTTK